MIYAKVENPEQETRLKNIITMLVDKTFTDLWDQQDIFSGKWDKASFLFVSHYPTPQQTIKIGAKRLAEFFIKHNAKLDRFFAYAQNDNFELAVGIFRFSRTFRENGFDSMI